MKAVEKGYPLAALRASRPASAMLFPAAHPMCQTFSGPQGVYAHAMPGELAPTGGLPSWGGNNGFGRNAQETIRVYSPSGSKGLDSIGQALSAALKVCCVFIMPSTAFELKVQNLNKRWP